MIPSTKRQRLIGLAVLVVTFLAGGFAGAAIRVVTADPPPARQDRDGDRDDDDRRERRFPYEYLGIAGEQRAEIEDVFERYHQAQQEVWQEVKPRFDAIVDSTRAEVNRLLTPEQRDRFSEYRKRRRERQSSEQAEVTPDSGRN